MDLPTSIKIYDVFYPSLLRKASEHPLSSQHNASASPVIVDHKEEWKIDDILDARKKRGRKVGRKMVGKKVQYCVK